MQDVAAGPEKRRGDGEDERRREVASAGVAVGGISPLALSVEEEVDSTCGISRQIDGMREGRAFGSELERQPVPARARSGMREKPVVGQRDRFPGRVLGRGQSSVVRHEFALLQHMHGWVLRS